MSDEAAITIDDQAIVAAHSAGYRLATEHGEQAILEVLVERDAALAEVDRLRRELAKRDELTRLNRDLRSRRSAARGAEDVQQMVAEFHRVKGAAVNRPVAEWAESRSNLFMEEGNELFEAIESGDPVAIMHESADVAYVAFGNAVALGYDLLPVIAEVHRANMSKSSDPDGKLAHKAHKGDGYRPADVAAVLAAQRKEATP